jgi:hypothetical protein
MCNAPVGLGANRTRILIFLGFLFFNSKFAAKVVGKFLSRLIMRYLI